MRRDRIEVRALRLVGVHGLLPEERSRPQPFEIDLDLDVDTADYGAAVAAAAAVVAGPPRDLLETLAGAIADAVLVDPRVTSVTVAVRKLEPPLAYDVASTGVRITRPRP